MKIGVTLFQTDKCPPPAFVAAAAEERGFSSYFVPEHTHIPVSRATPWPMNPDVQLPESYARVLDPYVGLATAAAVTSTIRLGTGVALIIEHDPIALAKQVATLDFLSGGRFVLGIGFGWNREEMADHNVAFAERRAITRESVLAMSGLWRDDVASYHGRQVHLSPSWAWPKPVQQPRPPILLGGGAGPKLFEAIADYADGWLPIGGGGLTQALPKLREAWQQADREGEPIVLPYGVLPNEGKLAHYADLGIDEVVVNLEEGDEDTVLRSLDQHAKFVTS
ncbi:MAG: LLM class F420-dependent oxidoreductase [Actinomycetes bacterium]